MNKSRNVLIFLSLVIFVLATYFVLRMQAIKGADKEIDAFFAEFPNANQEFIKKHSHLIDQDFSDALAIIDKHRDAVLNFDYKNTTPAVNLTLNEASVPVSWHLTIFFRKENAGWYISRFDEYTGD